MPHTYTFHWCEHEDAHSEAWSKLPSALYTPGVSYNSDINTDFLAGKLVCMHYGQPIARLAVYLNPAFEDAVLIGNYECIDHMEVSQSLLQEAFAWARARGKKRCIGPMNGSTWDHYRFKTSTNDAFISEAQQPLYYPLQWEAAGWRALAEYQTAEDRVMETEKPEWIAREKALVELGVTTRSIDTAHLREELTKLYGFNTLAFQRNEMYSPISLERFLEKYIPLQRFLDPEWVKLAEDHEGNMLGFIFTMPDLLSKDEKRLVIKTIARHPDPTWKSMGSYLANPLIRKARAAGFQSVLHAYMFNGGTSTPVSKKYHSRPWATYRLYECIL